MNFFLEAEIYVLSCITKDYERTTEILNDKRIRLNKDHFNKKAHKEIFSSIVSLLKKGEEINLYTIGKECEVSQKEVSLNTLKDIYDNFISFVGVDIQAKMLIDNFAAKNFKKTLEEVHSQTHTVEDFPEVIYRLEKSIETIENKSTFGITSFKEFKKDYLEELNREKDVSETGFRDLDQLLGGLHPREMTVIGACTSHGKTAMATNIASHFLDNDKKVCFISLEMSKHSIINRLISLRSKVPLKDIKNKEINDSSLKEDFLKECESLSKKHFFISESDLNPIQIKQQLKRIKKTQGLDLVIIDYLQLLNLTDSRETREREIAEISKILSRMAKELDIILVCLAQLNRNTDHRGDKTPQLSDIRESGAIEQSADLIILFYNPDRFEDDYKKHENKLKVFVRKNRNGETGKLELQWNGQTCEIKDIEKVAINNSESL